MRLIDADALQAIYKRNSITEKITVLDKSPMQHLIDAPTVDAVSRDVLDQVMWERDVAIEQLKSYGVSFGEKADVVKVVRCKDCEYKRELEGHLVCGDSMRAGMGVDVFEIPTYYFNKIAPDDFCSRGRRKDNG